MINHSGRFCFKILDPLYYQSQNTILIFNGKKFQRTENDPRSSQIMGEGHLKRLHLCYIQPIGLFTLITILMNIWSNDFSGEYQLSEDQHLHFGILDNFNNNQEPIHNSLDIDLDYFTNKFPVYTKPEVVTTDSIQFFKVVPQDSFKVQQQENVFFPPIQLYEKKEEGPAVNKVTDSLPQKTQIEFSDSKFWKRSIIEKGERFQTKNLCKHLHTETSSYLKKRAMANMFSKDEMEMVRAFCSGGVSIDTFKSLFKNERLCKLCRNYYRSKFFVQQILTSKMDMKTKITMIKYLDKICYLTYDKDFKSWKKDKDLL